MTTESMTYNHNTEINQWGREYLLSNGYTLKNNVPEIVQQTPWSYVIRFVTTDGYIYLKHTPEQLALEAKIIQILHDRFHAHVPEVIAHSGELNCFLMKDAGKSLRSILKLKFDEDLLCRAIVQFTSLQLAVADDVNVFLNIGVPDWRLNKLPGLYEELISQKELLIADGLTEIELDELEKLIPTVSSLCQKLSQYSIKPTIVQPDFNDNNNLIEDTSQTITLIDVGEIVISHPFFSLINCLYVMKKHHGLKDEDASYLKIKDACLENFIHFESKKRLLDAFPIAEKLLLIYGALSSYRLMVACDQSKFTPAFQRHGRPSQPLKEFCDYMNSKIDRDNKNSFKH
ncbi:MAG: phosphotransferase [Gammaproteobacteria bacterium]|nr:phosphotransferase [Gammaproteobacteria bacterium]